MGTSSPVDSKKNTASLEADNSQKAPSQGPDAGNSTPPRSDQPSTAKQNPDQDSSTAPTTTTSNAKGSQPLAPPPRPTQQNASETPDYFSSAHGTSHFSLEPNPFEQSFGNPAAETPGKSLLPPVAALTSPASLLQGGSASGGFNWSNSLRSGPLSPAMLTGPTGSSNDYFDPSNIRANFPTPNESSLRTGLTPGGGGSMFPAPSPNSQALYQQLASGGATPGTIDFHRTAMNFANRKNDAVYGDQPDPATAQAQAQDQGGANANVEVKQEPLAHQQAQQQRSQQQQPGQANASDPFGQHDANDAANGLFLLANARNAAQSGTQAATGNQNLNQNMDPGLTGAASASMGHPMPGIQSQAQSQETSPHMAKRAAQNRNGSMAGSMSGSARGLSEMSGEFSDSGAEPAKPNTRHKGKKGGSGPTKGQTTNGRRKAEETPSKPPANKKAKGNDGLGMPDFGPDSDDSEMKNEGYTESGRKMTDEEKRKNFLERNRVAALKCRQRKKQWLANLQNKVEIFSGENDALSAQVTQLREEIVNLKTLLLAHKDCPVSQAQGLGPLAMSGMPPDFNHHANPYGMAMANNGQVMAGQGMQRGYVRE
ncbi:MAG: hypothetical protein M1837_000110 [Sclerophora amabilis]|nr:MAG: hypothetical protein M1837_000110 [Sclerophora amabilis]